MEPPRGRRRRRRSIDEPPYMSELMNSFLKKHSDSFIEVFDSIEHRMRQIVKEFQEVADEVKQMQKSTDLMRTGGAVVGGAGLGVCAFAVGFLAAPITGGTSLAAAAAAAAAIVGGSVVVGANIAKILKENGSAKKVEELGNEFMKIVEPLKKILEDIQMTCEKLEKKSSEDQAETSLTEVEKFQTSLRRVTELREKTKEALIVAVALNQVMDKLLMLIVSIFTVTATPVEDEKLRDGIIQSADQSQEVIDMFFTMTNFLRIQQQQQTETSETICD